MVKLHNWQDHKEIFTLLDKNAAKKIFLRYIKNGNKLLDVGCGDCSFFDFVKKHRQCEFHAQDINEDALAIAKGKGYTPHDTIVVTDSFDVVSMIEVFEHLTIEDRIKVAGQINKILKPNGFILMTFPHVRSSLSVVRYFDNLEHKVPYVKEDGVLRIFEGYKLVAKKHFTPWLNPVKIISCLITGASLDSIYNSICLVLQKPQQVV